MTDNAKELLALDVDALAQEIRRVDGSNSFGAGALAEALMPFIGSRLSARQQASVEGVAKSLWLAGFKRAFDREPSDPWENQGEAVRHPHMNAARALLAKYDIFEKVEG